MPVHRSAHNLSCPDKKKHLTATDDESFLRIRQLASVNARRKRYTQMRPTNKVERPMRKREREREREKDGHLNLTFLASCFHATRRNWQSAQIVPKRRHGLQWANA